MRPFSGGDIKMHFCSFAMRSYKKLISVARPGNGPDVPKNSLRLFFIAEQ